jgi:hypothetical protein
MEPVARMWERGIVNYRTGISGNNYFENQGVP